MELDLPGNKPEPIKAKGKKITFDTELSLWVQFYQTGSVTKAAKIVGINRATATAILTTERLAANPRLRDAVEAAQITPEWVFAKLKAQAEHPGTFPAHRMANIRALEILAKAKGMTNEKKEVDISITHKLTALVQKAEEFRKQNQLKAIDTESRILPTPESNPLRDQNHSDGRE